MKIKKIELKLQKTTFLRKFSSTISPFFFFVFFWILTVDILEFFDINMTKLPGPFFFIANDFF